MIIALDARPIIRSHIQGAEQRARNILAAWARGGTGAGGGGEDAQEHQFCLICPSRSRDQSFDDSLLRALPSNFRHIEIPSFRFPSSVPMGSRVLNALSRVVGRTRADVYHSFTPEVPRISACPVVPTVHDLSFTLDPVVRRTAQGRMLHRVTRRGVQYAQRLIAISSQTKSDVASVFGYSPERIDVVYNGIDPAFTPAPASDLPVPRKVHLENLITDRYVLAVGADIPRRNYARLLAAMQIVWETPEGARTRWVLAGRDDWKISDIYTEARDRGVLDRMRFVRAPGNADLADLYRGAVLTCCASSFEGFGLSVLESMACGTAVACSDMRSLREVAENAAVYFPHDDAKAMGEAIAGLLEDAEYRRQLKYRGIYRASLFTWDTAARLTLESLEAAVRK